MPAHKGAGTMRRLSDRRIALSLRAGEEALLYLRAHASHLVAPLPAQPGASNSYGVQNG